MRGAGESMAMIDSNILRMMMWDRCGASDVEVNKGRARWDGGLWIRYKVFEEGLAEAPVAIVPHIRYCRDCRYMDDDCNCTRYADEGAVHSTMPDGFCWLGEKRR